MPAPIVGGFITFLSTVLQAVIWDGEIPRYDAAGNPINPDSAVVPNAWPAVKVYMKEDGFTREETTEDPYDDEGEILIQIWSTSRTQTEAMMGQVEAALAQASNWPKIQLGGDPSNPNYVVKAQLRRHYSGQEEGVRTARSELLYRGDLHYEVFVHGAITSA